jgi:hypothetical protein
LINEFKKLTGYGVIVNTSFRIRKDISPEKVMEESFKLD